MTARQWGLLGGLAILWGASFFFSKVALAELPPFTLVLGRFGLAALALLVAARERAPDAALTQAVGGLPRARRVEQLHPVRAHRLGPGAAHERARLHPERDHAALSVGARTWGALLGLALLSTARGFVIYFRLLATAGATNVMLVTLLMPVIALLLGWLLLGERVTGSALAGMALIFCGLLAIDGRLRRRRRVAVDPRARSTPA